MCALELPGWSRLWERHSSGKHTTKASNLEGLSCCKRLYTDLAGWSVNWTKQRKFGAGELCSLRPCWGQCCSCVSYQWYLGCAYLISAKITKKELCLKNTDISCNFALNSENPFSGHQTEETTVCSHTQKNLSVLYCGLLDLISAYPSPFFKIPSLFLSFQNLFFFKTSSYVEFLMLPTENNLFPCIVFLC